MRALSLWQPWATLIAVGAKRHETRSWMTAYRGPLAIHASKTGHSFPIELGRILTRHGCAPPFRLPFGAIVAVCDLTAMRTAFEVSQRADVDADDIACGDFAEGRYAWELSNVRALSKPVPCKGRQGLWTLSPEFAADVLERVNG